ncbi:MAG TPA: MFS transporter, partial [Micromonosporaceae bacterium]
MREVLRRPSVGVLFAGEVASMAGDSLMLLVLMIWVKSLTGSNGAAGAVMLTIAGPALLGPLFGWITDRFRRRPFLIVVNILSGIALLPLLAVHTRADVWIIYVVGLAYGVSFTLTEGA